VNVGCVYSLTRGGRSGPRGGPAPHRPRAAAACVVRASTAGSSRVVAPRPAWELWGRGGAERGRATGRQTQVKGCVSQSLPRTCTAVRQSRAQASGAYGGAGPPRPAGAALLKQGGGAAAAVAEQSADCCGRCTFRLAAQPPACCWQCKTLGPSVTLPTAAPAPLQLLDPQPCLRRSHLRCRPAPKSG
jgi:hypothetical protein